MYIEPNTSIYILKNCPLDTTYEHTIYFDSKEAQANYFAGLTKYHVPRNTYQRVNRGTMRVQHKADDLYDCNYLMFQNTNYGNKWFYAFIKSVEYVNNVTSEITYEIDVMQTWHFDYELGECFIDREHSATDAIGDNIVPEDVELGEYIATPYGEEEADILSDLSIVVACTFDDSFESVGGEYYTNVFSGLYYHSFPNSVAGATACSSFLTEVATRGKGDGVVCAFLMPTAMISWGNPNYYTISKPKMYENKRLDGSAPKNRKLYTHPYNTLYITDLQGMGVALPYEYFNSTNCEFTMTGDYSPNPCVLLAPNGYKGAQPTFPNYDEKLTLSGYPQLSFNIDTFKQWLATSGFGLGASAITSSINVAGAMERTSGQVMPTLIGDLGSQGAMANLGAYTAAMSAVNLVASVASHRILPPQNRGGNENALHSAIGLQRFFYYNKHLMPEFVTIIDDFFSMYGYATHKLKVPNRNVRPHWCFTKCATCVLTGSVPCDDMSKIQSIYQRGITFWKNGNEVGNYSLPNGV